LIGATFAIVHYRFRHKVVEIGHSENKQILRQLAVNVSAITLTSVSLVAFMIQKNRKKLTLNNSKP
jgi:hypothetical protein